jgi:hypothetical protein
MSNSAASELSLARFDLRIVRAMQSSSARGETAECVAKHSRGIDAGGRLPFVTKGVAQQCVPRSTKGVVRRLAERPTDVRREGRRIGVAAAWYPEDGTVRDAVVVRISSPANQPTVARARSVWACASSP